MANAVSDALGYSLAGLDVTKSRIDTLSRNIANAQTDGYTKKTQGQTTGPIGEVDLAPITRNVDTFLQNALNSANGTSNRLQTTVNLLQNIETAFGTPSSDSSLSAQITALQTAFQDLSVNPEQSSLLTGVLNAATALTRGLNGLSQTIQTTNNDATTQISTEITSINQTLRDLDAINQHIVVNKGANDTTDDEDQRDRLIAKLAGEMDIVTYAEPDGAIAVYTKDGKPLDQDGVVATLSIGGNTGITWSAPGASPTPINITNGTIGGLLNLQKTVLPGIQAQLDDIARALTVQFNTLNVPLFNDGGTNDLVGSVTVPAAPATVTNPALASQVAGYASRIGVNQLVIANPNILHDGAVPPALNAAAPALAPGDTTVINSVLTMFNSTSIGFSAAGLPATGSLVQVATNFVTTQGQLRADAQTQLDNEKALIQSITNKISAESGVNVDNEVAQLTVLQNAYSANARVMATTKAMFDTLFNAVQ
jgi:flagellar hook-associated protein 1 FlgK